MLVHSNQTLEKYHLHFETNNASFLKMAVTLRKMGIKNWYFFLKIYDKSLVNVNPYSKDLTEEQKAAIAVECSNNRWYYYRELFRVGESGGSTDIGGGVAFGLNRGNLAYLWATDLNLSTYMILPRQTGKTWAAIADCSWVHQFNKNSTILHFNKNQTDANDNLTRIKLAISMLPVYLQHSNPDLIPASEKRKIKNNEKTIKNVLNSSVIAMSSAGNETKADTMARGRTAEKTWYDELAFIFFNKAIYTAATPAFEKARENAIKNQSPYGISITTTPGDLASPHGVFAYKMIEKCVPFSEEMYDWSAKKLYKEVYAVDDKSEHMPFIYIEFNYLQLGLTDEWYRKRYANLGDPIRARREYLLEWIDTNGNSPFDPDDIELIGEFARSRERKAKKVKISKYFTLNIYEEYHGKKPVLIGCDVSGSVGRDNSTLVAVNPETLMPLAIFQSNTITSRHFAKLIVKVGTKIYPHCIITVENNSVGGPLIDQLRDSPVRSKIYRERKKKTVDVGVSNFSRKKQREMVEFGHNTNTVTRPQMMDTLESLVRYSQDHVGYPELYNEIRFMQLRNGRIDHGSATHDDVTMAYMGVLWIVRYGKGLKGKSIYWNISDGSGGEDDYDDDDSFSPRYVDRAINKKSRSSEDDFVDYMMSEHEVVTAMDLERMQRAEYLKERDRIDGVGDEFDEDAEALRNIDKATERMLLRHYNTMFNSSGTDLYDFAFGHEIGNDVYVPSGVGLYESIRYD